MDTHRLGGHSGQWGLGALLLSFMLLFLFPLITVVILGALIGAWNIYDVEIRHIDFGVLAGKVIAYSLLGLGGFALLSGLWGILSGLRRGQPLGLPLAGTLASVVALGLCLVLVQITHFAIEDTQRLKTQHRRFRPASAELQEAVRIVVAKDPTLKPDHDKAMVDAVLTQLEAENILIRASVLREEPIRVEIRRP
jgi:hypothetical protein